MICRSYSKSREVIRTVKMIRGGERLIFPVLPSAPVQAG